MFHTPDEKIREILTRHKTVAIVGLSGYPSRDSYKVAEYLKRQGYKIIPINPRYRELLGERCYPSLLDVTEPVEIVDIFRKPQAVPQIVEQAIQKGAKVIWMQKGIVNNSAAEMAIKAGLDVVMDRCMMVEHMVLRKR
ncbi:CoA-binding protein [Candidatus Poribacteria bacterium]|nr:CoA-binding protein [Candidatus Poribacteria bacterium]